MFIVIYSNLPHFSPNAYPNSKIALNLCFPRNISYFLTLSRDLFGMGLRGDDFDRERNR
jgi:hypothetical protein